MNGHLLHQNTSDQRSLPPLQHTDTITYSHSLPQPEAGAPIATTSLLADELTVHSYPSPASSYMRRIHRRQWHPGGVCQLLPHRDQPRVAAAGLHCEPRQWLIMKSCAHLLVRHLSRCWPRSSARTYLHELLGGSVEGADDCPVWQCRRWSRPQLPQHGAEPGLRRHRRQGSKCRGAVTPGQRRSVGCGGRNVLSRPPDRHRTRDLGDLGSARSPSHRRRKRAHGGAHERVGGPDAGHPPARAPNLRG